MLSGIWGCSAGKVYNPPKFRNICKALSGARSAALLRRAHIANMLFGLHSALSPHLFGLNPCPLLMLLVCPYISKLPPLIQYKIIQYELLTFNSYWIKIILNIKGGVILSEIENTKLRLIQNLPVYNLQYSFISLWESVPPEKISDKSRQLFKELCNSLEYDYGGNPDDDIISENLVRIMRISKDDSDKTDNAKKE